MSSALTLTIFGVMELEFPFDGDSTVTAIVNDFILPLNPRFSSIVEKKDGVRKWKRVEVNLKEHVYYPIFPSEMTVEYYDECFTEYLSKLSTEHFPENRPLWELHIVKYPTKNAAGNIIFKLHHSLGDGYSIIGSFLSRLKRVDDPLMPLTFPSRQSSSNTRRGNRVIPRFFSSMVHTVYDFGWAIIKSSLLKDDTSPIKSGDDGVECKPIVTTTTSFSIDRLKEIKNTLNNVTLNDVITGIVSFGIRLYMQKISPGSEVAESTALMVFNTRGNGGYKSVDEMVKANSKMPWGNKFAFLHVPIPKLNESEFQNPLNFINKAHSTIKRHKASATLFLTGQLFNFMTKIRGYEATGRYAHATLKSTSLLLSNLIGPVEQMALANQPIKDFYFFDTGFPQSLVVTMVSYVGKLRIVLTMEKGFMDPNKLKSSIEHAFEIIYKAALEVEPPSTTKPLCKM